MVRFRNVKHLVLTYAAVVFFIVHGVFTSHWSATNFRIIVLGKVRPTSGLVNLREHGTSGKLPESNSKEAIPTLMVLAGCVAAVGCALTFTVQFMMVDERSKTVQMLTSVAFVLAMGGALLIFLGCMIYSYDIFTEYVKPGYSFYMTFCGAMILSLGGSLGPKY